MAMHNPPHPGAFIQEVYLTPNKISCRELALKLGVAASTLNRVLNEASGVSPEMALRLSKALGRSPESWTGHGSGGLTAMLPREAPCQEAAAKFTANLTERRRHLRATEWRRVDAAIPAKNLDRKLPRFSAEKTPTIMVAERGDGRRARANSHRDGRDRHKGKGAIQLAAASKKGERKIRLSRR